MKETASLFREEERIITHGEAVLAQENTTVDRADYAQLLKQYKRLHRQSVLLVKMGDRMQGQLNRLNEQLAQSEEKYRSIFETSIQGIYRSTPEGRFLDLNPAMARIFGYASAATMLEEVQDIGQHLYISPCQRQALLSELQHSRMVADYQLQLRRRDGETIWVEISARGIFDAQGHLLEMEGLVADVSEKRRMLEELEILARCDGLTGLCNRRHFFEIGQREIDRSIRENTPLSLVYFDADHFKNINDTHGHEAGDKVLQQIALHGSRFLRKIDLYCRMGGEEFAILLPGTPLEGALHVAEKFRAAFEEHSIPVANATIRFTASFGVAQRPPCCTGIEQFVSIADKALYEAKHSGRNCVLPCVTDSKATHLIFSVEADT